MKGFIFSVLLLILTTTLKGQNFNNKYHFGGTTNFGLSVVEVPLGYVSVGVARDALNRRGIALLKVDFQGVELEKKLFLNPKDSFYFEGGTSGFIKTSKGDFALGGAVVDTNELYNAMLYRFDSNGDSLWFRSYPNSKHQVGHQCKETADGGFIIVGSEKLSISSTTRDVWVLKTDSLGNKEWEKSYPASGEELAYRTVLAKDNGYLLSGYTNSFGAGGADAYVIKIDSLGNKEWQQTLGGPNDDNGASSIAIESGYLCGYSLYKYDINGYNQMQIRIAKLDSVGNIKWDKGYGPIRSGMSVQSTVALNNGNYAFCIQRADTNGIPESNGFSEGAILILNENGDSLNYTVVRYSETLKSSHLMRGCSATTDGGLVVSGATNPSSSDSYVQGMWVVKMDEWGCLIPGCEVGLDEKEIQAGGRIRSYPNPFSEYSVIEINTTEPSTFKLFDVTGKMHLSTTVPKGITYINIQGNELSPGIWFCTLELNNGNRVTQKIVKEK